MPTPGGGLRQPWCGSAVTGAAGRGSRVLCRQGPAGGAAGSDQGRRRPGGIRWGGGGRGVAESGCGVVFRRDGGFWWGAAVESEQTAWVCPACSRGGRGSHRGSQQGSFPISVFARPREPWRAVYIWRLFFLLSWGPGGTQPHAMLWQGHSCTVCWSWQERASAESPAPAHTPPRKATAHPPHDDGPPFPVVACACAAPRRRRRRRQHPGTPTRTPTPTHGPHHHVLLPHQGHRRHAQPVRPRHVPEHPHHDHAAEPQDRVETACPL